MSSALRAAQRATQRILSGSPRIVSGQPIPGTHPELLQPGEVQPGITAAEFASRRQALAEQLPAGGLAVIQASPQMFMAGVIPYPYRQEANFQYLTGITQPSTMAIVQSEGRLAPHKFTLIVPDTDRLKEAWDGAQLNKDAAMEAFGADQAYVLSEATQHVESMFATAPVIAIDTDAVEPAAMHSPTSALLRQLPAYLAAKAQHRLQPLRPAVHHMRWRKSAAEAQLMRNSAAVAAQAMRQCMQKSYNGVSEHQLATLFEYECKKKGAQRMAYPPVVAGGADALTIHYS